MNYTNEQKEIVKEIKKEGYDFIVEYSDECYGITLELEDEVVMEFELEKNEMIYRFGYYSSDKKITKKIFILILSFVETITEKDDGFLLIRSGTVETMEKHTRFHLKNHLKEQGFDPIGKKIEKNLSYLIDREDYIKKDEKEDFLKEAAFRQKFINEFSSFQKALKAFYIQDEYEDVYEFYYHGYEGILTYGMKGDSFTITVKEDYKSKTLMERIIKEEKDISNVLKELFEEIKKKRRLKNLFEEPKYFFDDMVMEQFEKATDENMTSSIYSAVRKYYSPIEIEEYAYDVVQGMKHESISPINGTYLLSFINHILYVDTESRDVFVFEKEKDVIEKITTKMNKKTKEILLKYKKELGI